MRTLAGEKLVSHPAYRVMIFAMPNPRKMPITPPVRQMSTVSMRNWARMSPFVAPMALRMPDLPRPLRDVGQHYVHDADPADEQGDPGDRAHDDVEDALGPLGLGQKLLGNHHLVILHPPVPLS